MLDHSSAGQAAAASSNAPTSGAKRPRSPEPSTSDGDGLSASDSEVDDNMHETDDSAPMPQAATAVQVPVREREVHMKEWAVYADTPNYDRDYATLLQHVSKDNKLLAEGKRALIVQQLRAAAETLQAACDQLSDGVDDDLAYDTGLDSVTQQETLRLNIQSHTRLADELAARDFDEWRRAIMSAPRVPRRPRNPVGLA